MVAAFRARRDTGGGAVPRRVPGVEFVEPHGAFYFFFRVDGSRPDHDYQRHGLLRAADDRATAWLWCPAAAFGDDRWVRLSYAVSDKELDRALDRLMGLIASWASQAVARAGGHDSRSLVIERSRRRLAPGGVQLTARHPSGRPSEGRADGFTPGADPGVLGPREPLAAPIAVGRPPARWPEDRSPFSTGPSARGGGLTPGPRRWWWRRSRPRCGSGTGRELRTVTRVARRRLVVRPALGAGRSLDDARRPCARYGPRDDDPASPSDSRTLELARRVDRRARGRLKIEVGRNVPRAGPTAGSWWTASLSESPGLGRRPPDARRRQEPRHPALRRPGPGAVSPAARRPSLAGVRAGSG